MRSETKEASKNVLGSPLRACCHNPQTGYYRDGYCRASEEDMGRHIVCAEMTDDFLAFTKSQGNDLSTPNPDYNFPGLRAGDRWCLCARRWQEAWKHNRAPKVVLEACHESTLEIIPLSVLKQFAIQAMN